MPFGPVYIINLLHFLNAQVMTLVQQRSVLIAINHTSPVTARFVLNFYHSLIIILMLKNKIE